MNKDYYKILGVERNASQSDIKKKFRSLSKEYHPDRQVGKSEKEIKEAEDKFKEINEAYSVLSDEEKRAKYDRFGSVDGFDYDFGGVDPFEQFKDFIRKNTVGGYSYSNYNTVKAGSSIQFTAKITLKELYNNEKHTIKYQRFVYCPDCNGTGSKSGKTNQCPHCHGSGMYQETVRRGNMILTQTTTCPYCGGSGYVITDPCEKCNNGVIRKEETFEFQIPYGCRDNSFTIISGMGNFPGYSNGKGVAGDLKIIFRLVKDDRFTIDQQDHYNLITSVEIPLVDCLLGCQTKIKNPNDEDILITIPPVTKQGTKIVVQGQGLMDAYGGRGNIIVYVNYLMPEKLTKEEIKLLNKLKNCKNFK